MVLGGEKGSSEHQIGFRPIWCSVCLQLTYQPGQGGDASVSHLAYSGQHFGQFEYRCFSLRPMAHFMRGIEQQKMPVFSLCCCLLPWWGGLHVAGCLCGLSQPSVTLYLAHLSGFPLLRIHSPVVNATFSENYLLYQINLQIPDLLPGDALQAGVEMRILY